MVWVEFVPDGSPAPMDMGVDGPVVFENDWLVFPAGATTFDEFDPVDATNSRFQISQYEGVLMLLANQP